MKLRPMMAMVCAASAVSLCATANAQPIEKIDWAKQEKFRGLDADGDGYLTKNEVSRIRGYTVAFGKADASRDSRLSPEEFAEAEAIHDRQRAAAYVSDASITAKVKTALIREHDLKSMDVSVETSEGRVQLSGWVADEAQRKKALAVASKVAGVKEVRNGMSIR